MLIICKCRRNGMRGWVEGKGEHGTGGSKGQIEALANGPRHQHDLKNFGSYADERGWNVRGALPPLPTARTIEAPANGPKHQHDLGGVVMI